MCKIQMLRTLVEQRLTMAADEIFVLFERALAEYDEELSRRMQEYERQLQPQDVAANEPPDVKEEEEEVWTTGREEIPLTLVLVKSEDVDATASADRGSQPSTVSMSETSATKEALKTVTGKRFKKSRARPFDCDVCHKSFTRKVNLSRHMRSHTGDKPSGRKTFKRRVNSTGEKPFACALCGKGFTQNGNLLRHARTHSADKPYRCDVCGRRFSDKRYIGVHMRTHTGEKPFPCSVCGRKFSDKRHVLRHMSMHTGGREAGSAENSALITITMSRAAENNSTG
ncbi:gastrula zinc finger protein XlCGF8.2DB-like [Phyllopteryx taeniolatus]|uniref:gastrula zinc finger protein XlCGF8.2DB-like n=1 Tax=Phyllopteryx taeniolatus TaxID=161469 RepID=UPI002AD2E711|nr:gastrula zinc finger protein XlCGF8.2DB-like [Phyllopteryx taeniolatus]